jgi:hypothetical protein
MSKGEGSRTTPLELAFRLLDTDGMPEIPDHEFDAAVKTVCTALVASKSETSTSDELRRDSEALVRLIELIKAMDLQAERRTERQGDEDVIMGYSFNTGLWHRILGTIAGHACAKWIQTPEGQARIKEAAERAAATIEELEKARAIDWEKLRHWRATI